MERRFDLARHGPTLLLVVAVALFCSIRLQLFDDEVPNPDISGILYNADGLLRGELAYVDNAELKPPGSFYLVALSFTAFGRDLGALQWFYTLWLLLGVPAFAFVHGGGSKPARRLASTLSMMVYLYYGGMFEFNYTSWMLPVYAWAYAAIVSSARARGLGWAVFAGVAATLATVIVQRGAVLGVVALVVFAMQAKQGLPWRVLVGWIGGVVLAALLVGTPYLARGEFGTLVEAVLPWALVAEYSSAPSMSLLDTLGALPALLWSTFSAGLLLVALSVAVAVRRGLDAQRWGPVVALAIASLVGTGLGGGRFYVHYLPQLVPALAVAAGGLGLASAWSDPDAPARLRNASAVIALLIGLGCVVQVALGDAHRYEMRARRLDDGKSAAQAAGAHIAARTRPEDRIYGWGWTAWRVYFWAKRRAPGRYYKALGRVTTFNSNTAFDAGGDVRFVPGPHADAFIADFDADPPAYFVLSPSFTSTMGARVDPLQTFTALRERLERDYRPEAQFGDLTVLRRVANL